MLMFSGLSRDVGFVGRRSRASCGAAGVGVDASADFMSWKLMWQNCEGLLKASPYRPAAQSIPRVTRDYRVHHRCS